jgi:hypothetical protein
MSRSLMFVLPLFRIPSVLPKTQNTTPLMNFRWQKEILIAGAQRGSVTKSRVKIVNKLIRNSIVADTKTTLEEIMNKGVWNLKEILFC